jgi:2-methylcitrate dehydratase PrpD
MVQRADLRALAAKVRYVVDPANPYPKQFTGHLRVTLKDGREMEARQGYFKGGADHPLSDADLQTKFFANCLHGGLAKPRAEAMLAMIQQIFDAPQVDLSLLGA